MSFTTADNTDNIYYDVVMNNPDFNQDFKAAVNQARTTPIIGNPSEYYLSIVRFLIPLQNIPIFNFRTGEYTVTIDFNGSPYQATVPYISSQTFPDSFGNQPVYSYTLFLNMVNTALRSAFAAYKLANPAQPQTAAPYLIYGTKTHLVSLRCQLTYYDSSFSIAAQPLKVYFNTALYSFFQSSMQIYNGYTRNGVPTFGRNFQIVIFDKGDNYEVLPASYNAGVSGPGYDMEQEYVTLYDWNDLRTIQIVSTTLKTRTEGLSTTNVDGRPIPPGSPGSESDAAPIITDFIPGVENGFEARSYVLYNPTAEYRLVDLLGTTPLKEINLEVRWTDKQGKSYPLYIPPGDSASFKLLFRRRGYILNNMEKIAEEQLAAELKGLELSKAQLKGSGKK